MSQMIKLPQQEMSVEALKALIAEAEGPRPVEGQVYRRVEATDANPWRHENGPVGAGAYLMRFVNGAWEVKHSERAKWEYTECFQLTATTAVQQGKLVPYTPPPPTFQVGQWVTPLPTCIAKVAQKVTYVDADRTWTPAGSWFPHELRPATPEEIAAATRITPKAGMLLKRKSDGAVFQCHHANGNYAALRNLAVPSTDADHFGCQPSTEDYVVLKSYLIEGAEP